MRRHISGDDEKFGTRMHGRIQGGEEGLAVRKMCVQKGLLGDIKMNEINFSHAGYLKFDGMELEYGLVLLEVFIKSKNEMSDEYVEYDTAYVEPNGTKGNYDLPVGKQIVLLFRELRDGRLLTTIRRYTPKKYDYYMESRGKKFDVVFR